jgi:membrane protein
MEKIAFREIPGVFKNSVKNWWDRDPFRESAVIAYNAIFSLPGLLVVIVTVAGYFFGADAVSGRLHQQITEAMGKETADQIKEMLAAAGKSKDSWWATIIGIIVIITGATGVFVQLQSELNKIWEVKASPKKSGILIFLRQRLFSFGLIISIAFLLLISLVISSVLAALGSWMIDKGGESLVILFKILNFIFSLAIITVLFALMFKILPDAKIKLSRVWLGAFLTALLFVIGKSALGLYFGKADPGSGYGAAGSIVLILLWVSYSSMIVFFGAEFTKAYSELYGEAAPSETAVKSNENKKP